MEVQKTLDQLLNDLVDEITYRLSLAKVARTLAMRAWARLAVLALSTFSLLYFYALYLAFYGYENTTMAALLSVIGCLIFNALILFIAGWCMAIAARKYPDRDFLRGMF